MAHMDIFNGDAFRTQELSTAVNLVPNQWGRIGELGIFKPKSIRGSRFTVEVKNGRLQLITSSARGTPLGGTARPKRDLKDFRTERFGLKSTITAEDIDGIRAYGTETELKQVQDEVAERQMDLSGSVDVTREFLRAGALQGLVLDADGSVLVDLFQEFGVNRHVVDFLLGTPGTDLGTTFDEVKDHIRLNLLGDIMNGVGALYGPVAWERLMSHQDFKDRWIYVDKDKSPLHQDLSEGFTWRGIYHEKYLAEAPVPQPDGSVITRKFIPDDEIVFFPMGTRNTFQDTNGSADYMEMVNQKGQPKYSKVLPDKQENRFVDVEVMMQSIPLCMRPATLVRGYSSN